MKLEITFEASVGPDASVLIAVAAILKPPHPIPSAFVWSVVPDCDEARFWISFDREIPDFADLIASLRRISGIKRILLAGPMHNVVL